MKTMSLPCENQTLYLPRMLSILIGEIAAASRKTDKTADRVVL